MRDWTRSLRVRLVLWLTGLCVVATIALLVGAHIYGNRAADRAFDRILYASALAIADQVYVRDGQVIVDLPYSSLAMLGSARNDSVFYRISRPDGTAVTGYRDLPQPRQPSFKGDRMFFDASYRGMPTRFVVLRRLLAEPGMHGWASVQVGQTRNARNALAREMTLGATLPIAAFMLVILALVWFGVSRGLAPLARVESELRKRHPTQLTPLEVTAPQEIETLVHAINHFMGRLQRTFDQTQHFIADATHQIRTPLASLKAQAELARSTRDPRKLQHHLERIDYNANLTTRLTNQLLSNAVITHRANVDDRAMLDLADIMRQAVHEAVPVADDRVDVVLAIEPDTAPLNGDAVALREAIRNLVENAIQYGGVNDAITVGLTHRDGRYVCTVRDHGPGIPADERQRVLERFYRGRNTEGPGSGLGLAIVAKVVERHHGRLTFQEPAAGGLEVIIELPDASS